MKHSLPKTQGSPYDDKVDHKGLKKGALSIHPHAKEHMHPEHAKGAQVFRSNIEPHHDMVEAEDQD